MNKPDFYDAHYPARMKAIYILETIAEELDNEDIFDGSMWYNLEDLVTKIIDDKKL